MPLTRPSSRSRRQSKKAFGLGQDGAEEPYDGCSMRNLSLFLAMSLVAASSTGCDKLVDLLQDHNKHASSDSDDDDDDDDDDEDSKAEQKRQEKKKKKKSDKSAKNDKGSKGSKSKNSALLGDIGFRPQKDGYKFKNTGGRYPLSPPVLTDNIVVKLFGPGACVGEDVEDCRLTPPASEWADMVNEAMNGGQCEGMAVSALTFWKNIDSTASFSGHSAHNLDRKDATPFIAYYWSYQTLNPVKREVMNGRYSSTPNQTEDKLLDLWKHGQFATLAFWGPPGEGGHAVTPYAVEDKGNGIHWIRIYDNNYPDTERYIIMDRNANTWKYDLAAINPDVPKMPWGGSAENHSILAIPLDLRLKKAECPFCRGTRKKTVWPWASSVAITDQQGRQLKVEGDKVTNEIPDAEVVDMAGWLEGGTPSQPIYILPDENDYEISISGKDGKAPEGGDDRRGVRVFGDGSAVTIDGLALKPSDKDTLSLPHDGGGLRYKTGTGAMPALKLAIDDNKTGVAVRIANMKADADSEVELKMDRSAEKFTVQGGGKSTSSYDIAIKHVQKGAKDVDVEQKAVKFKLGESHAIDTKSLVAIKPGVPVAPLRISRGVFTPPKLNVKGPKIDAPKPDASKPDAPKVNPAVKTPVAPAPVVKPQVGPAPVLRK